MIIYNIIFQFLLILLIIIILLYIKDFVTQSESFDEKINNTNIIDCGKMCTKIIGCQGFLNNAGVCYLSKKPILGKPEDSIFNTEYNKTVPRCNKVQSITDPVIASELDYKKNATYICTPNEVDNIQTIKMYMNGEKTIKSLNDLDKIPLEKYTLENIEWGKTIGLESNKKLIANPTDDNSITIMNEFNDEFIGQYMYPHKCSANISQMDCMLHCLYNGECYGTEWNPMYVDKNNLFKGVCCPLKNASDIIKRRKQFENGHFYVKQTLLKDNLNDRTQVFIAIDK